MLNLSSSGSPGRAGPHRRRAWLSVLAVAGALALGVPTANAATMRAAGSQQAGSAARAAAAQATPAQTTRQYVIRFWPRWITYYQQLAFPVAIGVDRLGGPAVMGPQFRTVNLINNDTLYTAGILNLSHGPLVLTIPPTTVTYSILPLDIFGNTFPVNIPSQTPGHYALVLKGWHGTLPAGVTKITIPYPVTFWNVRADFFSSTGVDMTAQAYAFRAAVRLASLAEYEANPDSGPVTVKPAAAFAFSFKLAQDASATLTPTLFLRQTQRAVHSATTQPLSASDRQLGAAFDQAFAAAQQAARRGNPVPLARIDAAVRTAYATIVASFMSHVLPGTNWIHYQNIAAWGTAYLDRAATTEYCQLCNNIAAAGYWQAFKDGAGQTLNGARHSYKLTFPANNIPDAKRFWSVTAYVPRTLELVPNRANKYLVARYTPGLVYNKDGSVTIYMAPRKPAGVPMANWLPVPRRMFNIALRVYGPTGNTAGGNYTPPPITVLRG
jgi:hypothetical protein